MTASTADMRSSVPNAELGQRRSAEAGIDAGRTNEADWGSHSIDPGELQRLADLPLPDVSIQDIHTFVVLARTRSFTRTGRILHLAQPSVSSRLIRLERALRVRLVNRETRPVTLTDDGEGFLPVAMGLMEALSRQVRRRHR